MTTPEQIDRDATAKMPWLNGVKNTTVARYRSGELDESPAVQAFTAHRLVGVQQGRDAATAEIVAWLRGPVLRAWGADCSGATELDFAATAIERGDHRK